jgi:hypothetical protein
MSSRIDKNSVSRLTMISLEKKKTPLILGFHHATIQDEIVSVPVLGNGNTTPLIQRVKKNYSNNNLVFKYFVY